LVWYQAAKERRFGGNLVFGVQKSGLRRIMAFNAARAASRDNPQLSRTLFFDRFFESRIEQGHAFNDFVEVRNFRLSV
jgi:hypothetical protein